MEAAINLLSPSSSFPPRTHFRSNFPSSSSSSSCSSSVPMLNEQASGLAAMPTTSQLRHFPASVLSLELHDEWKPSFSILREVKGSQSTLERQKEEEVQERLGPSLTHLQELENQLYHSSGLSYLLPSLGDDEDSTSAAVDHPMDAQSSDVISLAREALSASKIALTLAESTEVADGDFDGSMSPRLTDGLTVKEKTVRSTRLLERRSKRRRPLRPTLFHETDIPERTQPKRFSEGIDHSDPLRLFLSGPETKQLLTLVEENALIREIQDFNKLVAVKEKLQSQFDHEPTVAQWADAVGLSSGALRSKLHCGKRSREKLIYANFRMVVYIAKQYQGRGLSLQDMLQEGSMGLMKSVEKFKPQAGCRFPSYAYWWIRQSIKKAIFQHSRTIRVPENMYSLLGKVLEAKRLCIQEGNHQPSKEELAKRVGITVEKLQNMLTLMRNPVSIQQPVWADQTVTIQEVTADMTVENPDISVERQVMRKHMRNLLGILNPRERKIIKLRYGIGSTHEKLHSLSELGLLLGLSKERVRQIESRALDKLKESLNEHGFTGYTKLLI